MKTSPTAIRTPEVSQAASKVAVNAGVRHAAGCRAAPRGDCGRRGDGRPRHRQRRLPRGGLKIFLTASPEIRAQRRWREHQQKGDQIDLQRTLEEIRERDKRDVGRATSPLVRAADAVFVDSTAMDPEESARLVVMLAKDGVSRAARK